MSKERKAELQRKLAMTEVPRPPAELLDRIKIGIPADLGSPDRSLWRSTLAMRIAASLMLLVTTGLVTWRLVQSDVRPAAPVRAQREPIVPAITRSVTRPAEDTVAPPPVAETANNVLESPIVIPQSMPAPPPAKPSMRQTAEAEADVEEVRDFAAAGSVAQMAEAVDSSTRRETESITITASAPAVAAVAAAPAPPSAPLPAPPPATEQAAQGAVAGRLTMTGKSRSLAGASRTEDEFTRVRESLARGIRPAGIDVEAIINHFAVYVPPAQGPFLLTTELTSAPHNPDRLLLRVSVDTSDTARAGDARLSVMVSTDAIASARRLGGGSSFRSGVDSPDAATSTIIYELTPRASLPPEAVVVTVDLESPSRKSSVTIIADETNAWSRSTRRHRLSTLAGLWAESLAQPATDAGLKTLARQLRRTLPNDPAVADLEKAIDASIRVPR